MLSSPPVHAAGCGKNETALAAQSAAAPAALAKIVIGLDDNFPPDGLPQREERTGRFDIDLAKEAAKRPASLSSSPIDWSAKEAELQRQARRCAVERPSPSPRSAGRTSASPAPTWRTTRSSVVPPRRRSRPRPSSPGKVIGIQDGSSAVDAVQKDPMAAFKELKKFGDNVTALMDLTTGRPTRWCRRGRAATTPPRSRTTTWCSTTTSALEEYGVGTRKDDTARWLLQKAMDEMKADGSAARISPPSGSARTSSSGRFGDRGLRRPTVGPASHEGAAQAAPPPPPHAGAERPLRRRSCRASPPPPAARPASRHDYILSILGPPAEGSLGHAAALPDHPAAGSAARPGLALVRIRASAPPARRSTLTSG